MADDRCLNCNGTIRLINYALGKRWMHVDPDASFPTEQRGTAWRFCRATVATPTTPTSPGRCSTCGGLLTDPPCSRSADGSVSAHTVDGGSSAGGDA